MARILKKLVIEDTSDCATCQAREKREFQMLREVKVKWIGDSWCLDCGRAYEVMTAEDNTFEE